ncbi:MAG TPA: NlpC/P60 family protein [Beijerinckiaceae bacterium]|jgi:hypothetical protein|nr:NlpC/P60 family protein [Beijerinckiaceae bacterium]
MNPSFDRRLVPARRDLAAAHLAGQVEAARFVNGRAMRVCDEVAPIFPQPSRDESIDTQALYGETMVVYEHDVEGWSWGQLVRDNYVGYIPSYALQLERPEPTHRIRVPRTLVYSGRSIKLPVRGALPLGAAVSIISQDADFVEVDRYGFVVARHLAPIDFFEADFVTVAEEFLHAPYLWGGKTWLGVDCSGLVQISLAAAGRAIPRDTDLQERGVGNAIPYGAGGESLRRGDLVFWKGHVGIMRDAEILLHANAHHMCVASEHFVAARERILAKGGGELTAVRRLPAD